MARILGQCLLNAVTGKVWIETSPPPSVLADRTFWAEVSHGFGPCSNGQVFFSNRYKRNG